MCARKVANVGTLFHLGNKLEPLVSEGITVAEEHAFGQLAERCALVQPADRPGERREAKIHLSRPTRIGVRLRQCCAVDVISRGRDSRWNMPDTCKSCITP